MAASKLDQKLRASESPIIGVLAGLWAYACLVGAHWMLPDRFSRVVVATIVFVIGAYAIQRAVRRGHPEGSGNANE